MESIRILILEDDESTGVLLSDFLRGIDGLEVLGVARDGMSGLARIYAETPDLLLLDLVMPKMSGLEVLRALREKPAGGEMKILVLSGVTDDATVQYALSLGACHYIMKPARHSALLDWIQMAFRPGPQEESGLVSAARWQLRRMGGTGGAGLTCTALAAAALTFVFTHEIIRSVTILVVFCPCALVLATPTAIMAAIGNATKHGFLVREGDALERLSAVSHVAFDKTGTLTYGRPQVAAVESFLPAYPEEALYTLCAAAEQLSEHPLGKAVVRSHGQASEAPLPPAEDFQMIPGQGVSAAIEGKRVLAGNEKLLLAEGVVLSSELRRAAASHLDRGCTVVYVAVDGAAAGLVVLSDTLREESAAMVKKLEGLGVAPVLLTGDHESAATAMAHQLGIGEVHAGCLPEDKLKWIADRQARGQAVCMIGDGVNDAPALKRADVGIAMGGVGSDIAVDAADIALVDDEVKELPHLLALSRRMMTTIKGNLIFSMGLNFLAIILAIVGTLNPVVGALVHNAGSVLVIVNSAFLLTWRRKE